ncbi:MAG: hypothetical protein WC310_00775 [Patescibacteria group bacterium]|jgi:hypothetical protein
MPQKFLVEKKDDYSAGTGDEIPVALPSQKIGVKSDKRFVTLIVVVVIATIILGLWQIKRNVSSPFEALLRKSPKVDLSALNKDSNEEAKKTDTDGDGLNDWDETNIYTTSIYLADTDSDGIDDGVEVLQGKNPLCPEGQDCSFEESIKSDTQTTNTNDSRPVGISTDVSGSDLLQDSFASEEVNSLGYTAQQTKDLAAKLRDVLVADGGMDRAALDQISDEELLAQFLEVARQDSGTGATANTNSQTTTNTNTAAASSETKEVSKEDMIAAVDTMAGTELRRLLLESGLDQAVIDKSNDDTLRKLLKAVLEEQAAKE